MSRHGRRSRRSCHLDPSIIGHAEPAPCSRSLYSSDPSDPFPVALIRRPTSTKPMPSALFFGYRGSVIVRM
jgi:hypothetical protein